jgi:hypothetical protein
MAGVPAGATRASEFFRLLDAKGEAALRAVFTDDARATDEITRGWLRGASTDLGEPGRRRQAGSGVPGRQVRHRLIRTPRRRGAFSPAT